MQATEADIRDLYQRYGGVLFHRCRSIMKNDEDANDAVQETFARVIRNWDSFRSEASPLTWMYRISTNHCLNQIRNRQGRQAKRDQHSDAIVGDGFSRPDTERGDNESDIRALLAQVDDQTRAIVTHLYFDDLTREETAVLVGISVPTLRKRLNHFLERSRKQLDSGSSGLAAGALIALILVLK